MSIRNMIRMILNESFESDKNELAELYPDLEQQISQLGPKWIMWLSSRFGNAKKREEVHPIEDAIMTILAFSKKDSAIAQKYKSSEQWRSAVDAQFPERKWSSPADTMTMTVDDMETLLAMSQRKKQNVDADSSNVNADFLAKVGPWNLWMPTTKENSCTIAGIDPLTMKPATSWCTARTSGSNLFYNYVARAENIILFYLIKDDATTANDRLSVGFVNGRAHLEGESGGVSVNGKNAGLTLGSLSKILGQHYDAIMNILNAKSAKVAGEHPAKAKVKEAAMNIATFHSILRGLSDDEKDDMKALVIKQEEISLEVSMLLAQDKNTNIRAKVAEKDKIPKETFILLAKDISERVKLAVANNDTAHPEALMILAHEEEFRIKNAVASNLNAPPEALALLSSVDDEIIRSDVARHKNTPIEVLELLAKDEDEQVKCAAASNKNATPEMLTLLSTDNSIGVKKRVANNKNTPIEVFAALVKLNDHYLNFSISSNDNTPPEILEFLAQNQNEDIKLNVAKNKNSPTKALEKLAKDADYFREAVAKNPNARIEILNFLANDLEDFVRIAVAKNSNTPTETLIKLSEEEDEYVRKHAMARLRQRKVYESVILKILDRKNRLS